MHLRRMVAEQVEAILELLPGCMHEIPGRVPLLQQELYNDGGDQTT